jgi:subtilisin family serine protease
MSAGSTNDSVDATTAVNGHDVPLFLAPSTNAPADTSSTDWVIVKFDRPVDYDYKSELKQHQKLEVHEHLGDNSYLCKYVPDDFTPVINLQAVSHVALYPDRAVPVANLEGLMTSTSPTSGRAGTHAEDAKMPFVIELHPNPSQSPEQVLEQLRHSFGADPLHEEIFGNTFRVKLDPAVLPEVAKIDSIRTVDNVLECAPFSVRQRAIMQLSQTAVSNKYKGSGEVVFMADTGFDTGLANDVHPAFTGRVLAATTAKGATVTADTDGHGTHVAGSILGNFVKPPGTDLSNAQGTAPEAKLVSIALNFDDMPPILDLLTQNVPNCGSPVIMNNSWGATWRGYQELYGSETAKIVDQVMDDNPNACILFAAGNDGRKVGSNGLQQHIGAYASAKNCITVGATYSDRPVDATIRYQAGGKVHATSEMVAFSSSGPTSSGRLKPDVVAPGAVILSARSRSIDKQSLQETVSGYGDPGSSTELLFLRGTSQAAPAVAGCVAVLRSAFRAEQRGAIPTGALLKALIVHGAVDLVGTPFTIVVRTPAGDTSRQCVMTRAPNPFQGYGLVNIQNSLLPIVGSITGQRGFIDSALASGMHKIYTMTIPSSAKSLAVTLAYTDAPSDALENQITLSVKLSNGSTLNPLAPTDPDVANRPQKIDWKPSNLAKISAASPPSGQADIFLNVISSKRPTTRFAVVWTVLS